MAKTIIKIILSLVLIVCFAGSIVWAIFSGDEFKTVAEEQSAVKGLMRIESGSYSTNYLTGDKFSFDKEASKIFLVAKDPAEKELVKFDDLPASDFGFLVNGTGEIIDDPSLIVMNPSITSISIVSKKYPSLKVEIPVKVIDGLDPSKLVSTLVYEGEDAQIYENGVLLTKTDLETRPDPAKPYYATAGTPATGGPWSGGNVLRNFQTTNMEIKMEIVCTEACDVQLEVLICMRKESKTFGEYYSFTLNGEHVEALDSSVVPKDPANGYFSPYTIPAVTVHLERGINVLSFKSGSNVNIINPVNFDAVRIVAEEAVLGIYEVEE